MTETSLSPIEQRALAAVDNLAEEMVAFTRALVRIPTINPPGERYAECANLVASRLAEFGYQVDVLPAEGMREHTPEHPRLNVLGRRAPAPQAQSSALSPQSSLASQPVLHFNGHYDVVPPGSGWTVDPFGGEVREERIYGRGTCDQKAGIATSVYAVEAIRRAGIRLNGTVEQSATVDEESGGFAGVAWLCDHGDIATGRQDYVVITEPLDPNRVCVGHRGVYWFEVTTLGRTGHGSMPGLAVNAVDTMGRLLTAIDTHLRPRLAGRLSAYPVEPPEARQPTINVNAIHAGQPLDDLQTACVVDRCSAVFDRRFIHEETFENVRAEIVALLDELDAEDDRFCYELRDLMRVDPVWGDPDGVLASTAAGAIRDVLGVSDVPRISSPGTYDQKHVTRRAGIDACIAYGPGRLALAHQPDEYVSIADLVASAKVMALLAMRLLGATDGFGGRAT